MAKHSVESTTQIWADTEMGHEDTYLYNSLVGSFKWNHIDVSVADKATGKDKYLLRDICGSAKAGQSCSIPS
jgi:hypothetical protein